MPYLTWDFLSIYPFFLLLMIQAFLPRPWLNLVVVSNCQERYCAWPVQPLKFPSQNVGISSGFVDPLERILNGWEPCGGAAATPTMRLSAIGSASLEMSQKGKCTFIWTAWNSKTPPCTIACEAGTLSKTLGEVVQKLPSCETKLHYASVFVQLVTTGPLGSLFHFLVHWCVASEIFTHFM